jgi:hypothetical protein
MAESLNDCLAYCHSVVQNFLQVPKRQILVRTVKSLDNNAVCISSAPSISCKHKEKNVI